MLLGNVRVLRETFVRYYSRKAAVNVRKINPKVPTQQAYVIAQSLYDVIKQHGPLTVSNTWVHLKEAGVSGLNSKTHMKIMLKWMRGRRMLKLFCNQVGSNKKFLHCTLPEEPQNDQVDSPSEPKKQKEKPSMKKGKKLRQ
ncbi:Tumor necrosis factor receptor family protein [Melia azedarach]|uniref:Tumor necrosis factor receptor family protein n=1 Tax=Melia azedarach TaxID=155640 RepID=A0ACC1XKB9_MELAZ|nr:Tumor necrosis factor receptor family protein [Melia azedarach]